MEELENKDIRKEEVYSRVIRAGKRTYFFDVKATRAGENYLTITESKRRFDNDQGKFFYEKHKVFLYKEDFDKFMTGLNDALHFIATGEKAVIPEDEHTHDTDLHADVDFDDLGPVKGEEEDRQNSSS